MKLQKSATYRNFHYVNWLSLQKKSLKTVQWGILFIGKNEKFGQKMPTYFAMSDDLKNNHSVKQLAFLYDYQV